MCLGLHKVSRNICLHDFFFFLVWRGGGGGREKKKGSRSRVWLPDDMEQSLDLAKGVAGVMIGRSAYESPWDILSCADTHVHGELHDPADHRLQVTIPETLSSFLFPAVTST